MSLTRFSVSLEKELLDRFDGEIQKQGYPTRSKAIADLISENLVTREWTRGGIVAGALILIYDHHRRDLTNRLMHISHDYHHLIISSQHVHLDHHNCLEIIVMKGKSQDLRAAADKLKTVKGVKYASLSIASTGKNL